MNQVLFQRQFALSYENIANIRRVLDVKTQALLLTPDLIQDIKLVCSEYCTNLLDHQQQSATHCTISYGKVEGQYRFAITDNGAPWAALAQQLSDAALPELPCESGMGLAIIKTIFPDFSYQVTTGGNTIEFALPQASSRKHLVIVDDSHSQLAMLCSYLEQDYQVSIFSQADDALVWLDDNHCDLVLTDLWMPNINGLEFRRLVANKRQHRLLPFVFLSGDTLSETMTAVSQSGIDDFLTKPIDKWRLLQVLERVLKRHDNLLSAFEDNLLQQFEHTAMPGSKAAATTTLTTGNFRLLLSREPEISGDFFIHQPRPDGSTMVILGDLMGHGVIAKANGGISYGVILGLLQDPDITPEQFCRRLNQYLYQTQANNLVCLLVLHLATDNTITLYNAGMPKPIHCTNSCHHIDQSSGLLGLFESPQTGGYRMKLDEGHSLHGYSDGLLETVLTEHERQDMVLMPSSERHQYLWQRTPQNHEDDRALFTLTTIPEMGHIAENNE
ncbi:response regulator [Photobacterium sp. DA100]|uniref:response regulator n=1 Tax=Photobacterium sp. DA100 TaxID=3027472 RepID=UPI0024797F63|nr:response regulator [Photobacterium sp. DA100]WEM42560.1 response regulator [Photobacterium sp. DA100]